MELRSAKTRIMLFATENDLSKHAQYHFHEETDISVQRSCTWRSMGRLIEETEPGWGRRKMTQRPGTTGSDMAPYRNNGIATSANTKEVDEEEREYKGTSPQRFTKAKEKAGQWNTPTELRYGPTLEEKIQNYRKRGLDTTNNSPQRLRTDENVTVIAKFEIEIGSIRELDATDEMDRCWRWANAHINLRTQWDPWGITQRNTGPGKVKKN